MSSLCGNCGRDLDVFGMDHPCLSPAPSDPAEQERARIVEAIRKRWPLGKLDWHERRIADWIEKGCPDD